MYIHNFSLSRSQYLENFDRINLERIRFILLIELRLFPSSMEICHNSMNFLERELVQAQERIF